MIKPDAIVILEKNELNAETRYEGRGGRGSDLRNPLNLKGNRFKKACFQLLNRI